MTNPEIAQRQAEVDAAQQSSTQNIAYARVIQDLAENINAKLEKEIVFTNKARKWARRWKQEAKRQSARRESLANHAREIVSVGESKTHATKMESLSARKWARRWKRSAVVKENKICELSLVQAVHAMALVRKNQRIAALENAARSCATCLYHTSDLDPVPEYCKQNCGKPDIRHAGWVFNEKRFAPKKETVNDNTIKTKI